MNARSFARIESDVLRKVEFTSVVEDFAFKKIPQNKTFDSKFATICLLYLCVCIVEILFMFMLFSKVVLPLVVVLQFQSHGRCILL